MDGVLSFVAVALRGECQLAIGRHLVGLVLQQARHVSVGDAVVVAAEADVVLFQFNGPEGSVELAVLVLPVGVYASDKAQQQQHHQNDDGQDDDVELRPGDFRQGRWCCQWGCSGWSTGPGWLRQCSAQCSCCCWMWKLGPLSLWQR